MRRVPERSRTYQIIGNMLDRLSLRNLDEVNLESWIRLNALRYLLHRGENRKNIIYKGRFLDLERDFKRAILNDICFEAYRCDNPSLKELLNIANERLNYVKRALEGLGYLVVDLCFETKTKLIVGISEEMFGKPIFEVGLMWDPYLNLPYIPGSSLKGAFRAYLTLKGLKVGEHDVDSLLGDENHTSYIVFADPYPIACKKEFLLVPEVTTPIYHEQEGRIQETQAQPVPVIYPVVNVDVVFRVIIGIKRTVENDENRLRTLKLELLQFIKEVLKQGIGAKTALGYGILMQT